jgi:hypothetical protein
MNPVLAGRGRRVAYLLLWLPVAALLVALLRFADAFGWRDGLLVVLPLTAVYAFVCLGVYYLCRARPLHLAALPGLVGTQLGAAAITASIWIACGGAWARLLEALELLPDGAARYLRVTPVLFGVGVLLFLWAAVVYYLLISYEASREAEHRALEFQVLSRDAELKNLRAQIHPHFLFNALNSISALVTRDPDGARRLCVLLADFLRQSLTFGGREAIALREELALAEKLLSIETVRFGARLRYRVLADGAAGACLVPPLLLQPLVENAVTHGIAHLLDGGEIVLRARRDQGRLELSVENPRDPEAPASRGAGVGLANVRKRVAAVYGPEGQVAVAREPDAFRVELSLPART